MKKRPLANVEWRKYISLNNNTLNLYLTEYGDDHFNNIIHIISQAHTNKFPSIILFEFTKSDIVSVVEQKDYVEVLQRLLNLCERLEKYEICSEIVKIQRLMKVRKKQPIKKSHKKLTIN